MTASVTIEQTSDGWNVTIERAEHVEVTTTGKEIGVDIIPDEDDAATPLDVSLAQ
jgi:hypothetical protein